MSDLLATIPLYVSVSIVLVDLAVAAAVWFGVTRIARQLNFPPRTQRRIAVLMAVIPAAWLLVAPAIAAAMQTYLPSLHPGAPNVGMLPLILAPVITGLALLKSPIWRQIVVAAPLHWLTGIQVYRVIGVVFLHLMLLGVLPAYFAIPAGYGDLISGLPAPLVAYWVWRQKNSWRQWDIWLNVIGLLDFVIAVGIGSGILYSDLSQILFGETTLITAPFAYFPLSLIPLFVVPIGIVLHLYSFIKLGLNPEFHPSVEISS